MSYFGHYPILSKCLVGSYTLTYFSETPQLKYVLGLATTDCYGSPCNKLITIVNYYLEIGLFCVVY